MIQQAFGVMQQPLTRVEEKMDENNKMLTNLTEFWLKINENDEIFNFVEIFNIVSKIQFCF